MKPAPSFLLLGVAAVGLYFAWPPEEESKGSGSEVRAEGRGGTEPNTAPGARPIALSTSVPAAPAAPTGSSTDDPAAQVGGPSPAARPATPPSRGAPAGVLALDRWHRADPSQRSGLGAGYDADVRAGLEAFESLFDGGASAYAARLRLEIPSALGPDFGRFARAFAHGGLAGLDRTLRGERQLGPAALAWYEALAHEAIDQSDYMRAGHALGVLIRATPAAGYAREWTLSLAAQVRLVTRNAAEILPAEDYVVRRGDSLDPIARRYRKNGRLVNWGWIADFNLKGDGVGGRRHANIRPDEVLKIPTTPLHAEIWRRNRICAVFAGDIPIRLYTVSVGEEAEPTPLGEFTMWEFVDEPPWWPPGGGRSIPYGNSENPLGDRWIGFKEKPSYGFHGTNSESTIGTFETQGCIRLTNAEVRDLFGLVPPGGKVRIHR